MFRMMRLKPPHGWSSVAWELAIVTLGVLIALAAQQWAEDRSSRARTAASKEAIRDELAEHYRYAVEWRTTYPCIQAQLARLRARLRDSGATLDPAPMHKEPGFDYVLRIPSKEYRTTAWQSAISDGVTPRLDPTVRRDLGAHYAQILLVTDMSWLNNQGEQTLVTMAEPLPLDPSVRFALLKEIETLGGRAEFMDVIVGQMIGHIQKVDMVPPAAEARALTRRFGTYRFCRAQRLPLRSFEEAMTAVPD